MADLRNHGAADDAERGLTVLDIWHTLRRNRWLVAGVTLLVTALGAVFTWLQDPVYASDSSLLIEDQRPGIALMTELSPLARGGRTAIETDIAVLQSRRIAEAAVDSLDLHVQLLSPAVPRSELLEVIHAPRTTGRGRVYTLERQDDGSYRAEVPGQPDVVLRVGQAGRLGPVTVRLTPRVARTEPKEIQVAVHRFVDAVALVRKYLQVGRTNRDVSVVTVRYQSGDREMAAAVPNVVAESFIAHKVGNETTEGTGMVAFLREQVRSYEEQLRAAEADLRTFRETANVVSPADEATEQVKRLAQRTAERDAKRAERDALADLLARITTTRDTDGPSPYRQLASFPVFLSNLLVQDYLQSITELENQRASLVINRTEAHRDVQGIDARVAEIEQELYRTARGYLESLDTELTSMDADLSRFGGQMASIPSRELEFARRQRTAELLEELYTLLQTRLKEAEISNAVTPNNIRILDTALVPDRPVSPVPLKNMVLALAFGVLLGVGAAMGLEALDTKVRTEDDAASLSGGVPVLGTIPRIRLKPLATAGRNGAGALGDRLVTRRDPRSPVSEAYRALRTNLAFAGVDGAPQVLVVTSAMAGDGKSTSAANLAVTLAQQGTPTLLVDADLRKGLLHHMLGAQKEPGLTHVLLGRATLDEAVQELALEEGGVPLSFLAAGVFPPNPAELLGSERMRDLLAELRRRYTLIVLDAPPLNYVTDAAVLGGMADSTLLVARAGSTEKEALRHAAGRLELLRASVGGVVLNDLDMHRSGYGYYGMEEERVNGRRNGKGH